MRTAGAGATMREQPERRISELRDEQRMSQEMLAGVEGRQAELRPTLLRISGAIQVLHELLASAGPQEGGLAPAPPEGEPAGEQAG